MYNMRSSMIMLYVIIWILFLTCMINRIKINAFIARNDDSYCGYILDGKDDYLSFSLGSRDVEKLQENGFTMMYWFQNHHKDKDGHFEQCLMSHSLDDYGR